MVVAASPASTSAGAQNMPSALSRRPGVSMMAKSTSTAMAPA
jgi:hypothetical protein